MLFIKKPKTSKDFVSWEPYTITETLTPNYKYMVLACDGLFDVMNHQEVADMTHKLFSEGQDPSSVAKSLVLKAINDLATEDNVTVIIVKIDWADAHPQQESKPVVAASHPHESPQNVPASPPPESPQNVPATDDHHTHTEQKTEEDPHTSDPNKV